MPFVIDASITACWAFRDADHTQADLALALWWFEVRNIWMANERRKRLTQADSGIFLRELARLPITLDRAPEESEVLALARAHRLSVYDAAYLELPNGRGWS